MSGLKSLLELFVPYGRMFWCGRRIEGGPMARYIMMFISYGLMSGFMPAPSSCLDVRLTDFVCRVCEHIEREKASWNEGYELSKTFSLAKTYVRSVSELRYGMSTNSVVNLLGPPDICKKRCGKAGKQYGYKFEYVLRKTNRRIVNVRDEYIVIKFDGNGIIESVSFEKGVFIDRVIFCQARCLIEN